MVSYFKTQWFNLLIGVICFGVFMYYWSAGPQTLALIYLACSYSWLGMSCVNYNDDRIKLLEKKQERDDVQYELVQELVNANKIDREAMKKYEERLKKLEDKQGT